VHCPLSQNIPDWLKLTAEGRLEEAYEVAPPPAPSPRSAAASARRTGLCEGNCVIEKGFESVTIGAVEKYIADMAWERGWVTPPRARTELPQSVGIIGAGPAGLAAAERLRSRGYQVHVYDRHDRAGGLMIYGIPNFKLEKEVVLRRWRSFEQGGIRFHLDCAVGRDVTLPNCASGTTRCSSPPACTRRATSRARAPASRASSPRSTSSSPPTATTWATPCRSSLPAR
jgi:glutamate synthase (NADPH/NADH) small chain